MNLENFTASRKEGSILALKFEIPPAEANVFYQRALKNYAGSVSLPGFRKGKAPAKMIEEHYKDRILDMAEDNAVHDALREALKKEGLRGEDLISQRIENKTEFSLTEPMRIEARVDYTPSFEARDYKGVKLTLKKVEVPAEAIDAELTKMAEQHATMVPVERSAANGDVVVIDFQGFQNDGSEPGGGTIPLENASAHNAQLVLGSNRFIPGFEEALVGSKTGEELDIKLTFPDDYSAEELRGKPVTFKVTVNAVKERRVPLLDDEFARDINCENLDAVRKHIETYYREQNTKQAREDMEADLLQKLREANPLPDLPQILVDGELERRRESFEKMLANMKITSEKYLKMASTTPDKLESEMQEAARDTVHSSLVLRAIARAEKLTVTSDELSMTIARAAIDTDRSPQSLANELIEEGRVDLVKFDILKGKALHFVLKNAETIEA